MAQLLSSIKGVLLSKTSSPCFQLDKMCSTLYCFTETENRLQGSADKKSPDVVVCKVSIFFPLLAAEECPQLYQLRYHPDTSFTKALLALLPRAQKIHCL